MSNSRNLTLRNSRRTGSPNVFRVACSTGRGLANQVKMLPGFARVRGAKAACFEPSVPHASTYLPSCSHQPRSLRHNHASLHQRNCPRRCVHLDRTTCRGHSFGSSHSCPRTSCHQGIGKLLPHPSPAWPIGPHKHSRLSKHRYRSRGCHCLQNHPQNRSHWAMCTFLCHSFDQPNTYQNRMRRQTILRYHCPTANHSASHRCTWIHLNVRRCLDRASYLNANCHHRWHHHCVLNDRYRVLCHRPTGLHI